MTYNPETLFNLQKIIGYQFKDENLLITALTHKSVLLTGPAAPYGPHNERLEFLGDSVLSLVTADYLFHHQGIFSEGDLSRLRAQYVCESSLALCAQKLKLEDFIQSDKAMRRSGSNSSKSVLADTLEAIIGAVYLDGGLPAARDMVVRVLDEPPSNVKGYEKDHKTKLQEKLQHLGKKLPTYVVLNESGPAHAPVFEVGVEIDSEIVARACGENKKIASQNAANLALSTISFFEA